ncbi:unnamed protein product, partial [Sphacelaria rigidula]
QVLINDQSSRSCAYGNLAQCPRGTEGKNAGWPRPPVGTNCHDSPAKTEYRLHEFGVMYRSHAFSYWPGFSLNPALWDLRRLEHSYRRKYNRPFRFNEGNIRQVRHLTMSVELLDAGIEVAYLPDVTFQHVGTNSAYIAN